MPPLIGNADTGNMNSPDIFSPLPPVQEFRTPNKEFADIKKLAFV